MKEKVLVFWSGGKKAALALNFLVNNPEFEIVGLLSVFDRETNRIPLHGIPDSLIIEQAKLLKLPLQRVFLPGDFSEEDYVIQVGSILKMYAKKGITSIAFGDLESDAAYRKNLGMKVLMPLNGMSSEHFNSEFFKTGHKALVTSVLHEKLGYNFLACELNEEYINRLPSGVDQASRNNEFHSFVTFGPKFIKRVPFSKAIAVEEKGYIISLVKEP